MEGDAPAHQANRAALRAGRPDLPPATAAGTAAVGLRQPQNLIAPRRTAGGRTQLPLVAGVGRRNRLRFTKSAGSTPAAERIPGLPLAALIAGNGASAMLIENIQLSPQTSRISR